MTKIITKYKIIERIFQDIIVQCNAIDGLVRLLLRFHERRQEVSIKNLFASIIWALHIFTTGCSTPELTNCARKQVKFFSFMKRDQIFSDIFY